MRRDSRYSRQTYNRNYRSRSNSRGRGRYEEEQGSLFPLLILLIIGIGIYIYSGRDWRTDLATVKAMAEQVLPEKENEQEGANLPVYRAPCTQANIAKIIAYTFMDQIPAVTETGEVWYKKYYNALEKDARFDFFKEENAQKALTYEETSLVLSDLLGTPGAVNLQGDDTMKTQPISLKTFLEGYENALSYAKMGEKITYETLGIVATPKTNKQLGQWKVLTDKGTYGFEGLVLDPFLNMNVKTIVKGQEVLGIIEAENSILQIPGCYIIDVVDGQAQIKVGEMDMTYPSQVITQNEKDQIGTITLTEGVITGFQKDESSNLDAVLRIGKDTIEFEKGGIYPYEDVVVYDSTPNNKWSTLGQVSVGSQVEYTIADGKVTTLNVEQRSDPNEIRVVLTSDGLGQYAHSNVQLMSEGACKLIYGDKELSLAPNEVWDSEEFDWVKGQDKVVIIPEENKEVIMTSIERQKKNPAYAGKLEIYKEADNTYTVVNDLKMEQYIAAVVPSEMPTSYGLEAAKVQAISARSFARAHMNTSQYAKYGAQVDDTTSTQVYNNVPANEVSRQAANETKGQVLVYNNDVVSGNFFSTSCGYTANFGETWANGEIFPTNTPVYLVARQQYIGDRAVEELSQEEDAKAFFKMTPEEVDAFDEHSPWFRWQVTMSVDEISSVVNSNIARLADRSPNMVKILSADGKWEVSDIETLGTVTNLQVKKRGQGGNIMELVIEGSKNTAKVSTEYMIRSVLAPVQKESDGEAITIKRGDGTTIDNMSMLPSAFFSPEMTYDDENNLKSVTLYGGGFGHGVGMSQSGVKGMVDRGYTSKQVISHYYPEVEIKVLE